MTLLEQHVGGTAEAFGYTNPSTGERFKTTPSPGSVLIGEKINTFYLQFKIGSGSPSGMITFKAWTETGTLLHTFGTYDASTIGSSWETVGPDSPTAFDPVGGLANSTILGAEFTGDSSNYLHQNQSSSDVYDYGNWIKNPASSPEHKTTDLWFTVDYGASTPTASTVFPPPPIAVIGGH